MEKSKLIKLGLECLKAIINILIGFFGGNALVSCMS